METTKKTFKGGYAFKRFPGLPGKNVEAIGLPEIVRYPLKDTTGLSEALVAKGDAVKAGQLLWQNDEIIGTPVIATINGTVESIKPTLWNGVKIPVITIKSDGTDGWMPVKGAVSDLGSVDAADIEESLYFSGVTALGSDGIPTRFKTSKLKNEEVEHLIVSHCEDDVYNTDLSVIVGDRIEDFNSGLKLLKKIMPKARTYMAINRNNNEWIAKLSASPIDEMVLVKPKYPQGMDPLVVEAATGKKIPAECTPANAGALVIDVQAVLHVFDSVKEGKPLLQKIITMAGPGFDNLSCVDVRIGTSFEQIVSDRAKAGENRYIINSAMNGEALSDLSMPVEPGCNIIVALEEAREGEIMLFAKPGFHKHSMMHVMANAFLPFSKENNTNLNGEERACLSCGNCYNICPSGLYPTQLFKYAERDRMDEVPMRYGIFRCIDCNLCTYGCTAKIQLADWIKKGKAELIKEGYTSPKEIAAAYGLKETE